MTTPSYMPPGMAADYQKWAEKQAARTGPATADTFQQAKAEFLRAVAANPEKVEIPYELTPAGEREAKFLNVCPEKFRAAIDYRQVLARAAFDRVLGWDGRFPGPASTGPSGLGKTFASWHALRRLYVVENKPFAWFPVRRLVTELEHYDKKDCADEFFRAYDFFKILFVDDLDKINWDFESEIQMLFAFFDWVYRRQKPCIVTTNRDRRWWVQKAGEAFTRRLFDGACVEVEFK